jgi:hypothetical protein
MSALETQVRQAWRRRLVPHTDRGLWLLLAAAALCVLGASRGLVPDARGLGTHTQLGLPPCGFLTLTGLPCPACGLTTSFAHLARGQVNAALHANALGLVLFACVLASLPLAMWASARNRAFFETLARMHIVRLCIAFACLALVQWIARVGCLLLG